MAKETKVGKVTHYFSKIGVGVIKLEAELKVGDVIHVKGATSDFEQPVESMQVDHQAVEIAKSGDDIGLKLEEKVREGDEVFVAGE